MEIKENADISNSSPFLFDSYFLHHLGQVSHESAKELKVLNI
jgi:hypothetical protein